MRIYDVFQMPTTKSFSGFDEKEKVTRAYKAIMDSKGINRNLIPI